MTWRAPLRIDFAGGFIDNLAVMRGEAGFFISAAIQPHVQWTAAGFSSGSYSPCSGLAMSTARNLLTYIQQHGGAAYLKQNALEKIADDVWEFENREYSIRVGKGDVYPIVYGGIQCWECRGEAITKVPFQISQANADQFARHLMLVYSGHSRDSEAILNEFNANYDSGTPRYRNAYHVLSRCGREFGAELARENYDACGALMEENWEAEKILSPKISSTSIDDTYRFAKAHGAGGGKLCGAGGGGYFVFYAKDRRALEQSFRNLRPQCPVLPFSIEYADIRQLNREMR